MYLIGYTKIKFTRNLKIIIFQFTVKFNLLFPISLENIAGILFNPYPPGAA